MDKLMAYYKAAKAFVWSGGQKRRYLACVLLGVILTLLAQCAVATEIQPFPKPSNPDAVAVANAGANAEAAADANAKATASSGGNSLSVTEARQAPAIAQGGLYLTGCGFSGNAGGSQSSGAAFLGLQFITPGCHDLIQIQNEASFGNVKTACELNRLTEAGKRNMKRLREAGLEAQPCADPVAPVPAPDLSGLVTVEQLNEALLRIRYASDERCDRKAKECQSK